MRAFFAVLRPLGVIGMAMSLSHLAPITVSLIYNDGALRVFCISMVFNFAVGMIAFHNTIASMLPAEWRAILNFDSSAVAPPLHDRTSSS